MSCVFDVQMRSVSAHACVGVLAWYSYVVHTTPVSIMVCYRGRWLARGTVSFRSGIGVACDEART